MPSLALSLDPTPIDLDTDDRTAALRALVDVAAARLDLDAERLLAAVLEREKLLSTGFGGGAAMPHVRLQGAKRFGAVLGRARRGVPFDAADGEPVRLFLLVVGPESDREGYRKLMAHGARFLKAEGPRLLEADDLAAALAQVLQEY